MSKYRVVTQAKKGKYEMEIEAPSEREAERKVKKLLPKEKILAVGKTVEQSVNQLGAIPTGPLRRRRERRHMNHMNARQVIGFLDSITEEWETLPKGWTEDSLRRFWRSLTGDKKHKITQCIKKFSDVEGIDDPGAFCASLARRVGYL